MHLVPYGCSLRSPPSVGMAPGLWQGTDASEGCRGAPCTTAAIAAALSMALGFGEPGCRAAFTVMGMGSCCEESEPLRAACGWYAAGWSDVGKRWKLLTVPTPHPAPPKRAHFATRLLFTRAGTSARGAMPSPKRGCGGLRAHVALQSWAEGRVRALRWLGGLESGWFSSNPDGDGGPES